MYKKHVYINKLKISVLNIRIKEYTYKNLNISPVHFKSKFLLTKQIYHDCIGWTPNILSFQKWVAPTTSLGTSFGGIWGRSVGRFSEVSQVWLCQELQKLWFAHQNSLYPPLTVQITQRKSKPRLLYMNYNYLLLHLFFKFLLNILSCHCT